jgi:hypothetical protein
MVLEYACPVWHPGLNKKQTSYIERIQKRCLKLIYPEHSYSDALQMSGLEIGNQTRKSHRKTFPRNP